MTQMNERRCMLEECPFKMTTCEPHCYLVLDDGTRVYCVYFLKDCGGDLREEEHFDAKDM